MAFAAVAQAAMFGQALTAAAVNAQLICKQNIEAR